MIWKTLSARNLILMLRLNLLFAGNIAAAEADQYIGDELVVHMAYLGMGVASQIERGENQGLNFSHDFVVLAMASRALMSKGDGFTASITRGKIKGARAVAAWISRPSNPAPIQAVGGWLAVHQPR